MAYYCLGGAYVGLSKDIYQGFLFTKAGSELISMVAGCQNSCLSKTLVKPLLCYVIEMTLLN